MVYGPMGLLWEGETLTCGGGDEGEVGWLGGSAVELDLLDLTWWRGRAGSDGRLVGRSVGRSVGWAFWILDSYGFCLLLAWLGVNYTRRFRLQSIVSGADVERFGTDKQQVIRWLESLLGDRFRGAGAEVV